MYPRTACRSCSTCDFSFSPFGGNDAWRPLKPRAQEKRGRAKKGKTWPRDESNRVKIFDTTLRDGEQSPGISLNRQEKVEIAHQLARLGVDIIEAGFPITSPGDFEAVQAIAREVQGPVICGLARTAVQDIDAAWNAIKDSERPRIHTFIATSDIHIERKLQTTKDDVKGQARAAVAHAKQYTDDVEFSPEDGSRSDVEFMAEVIQIAIDEGATTINVPDTVGYTMPHEYAGDVRGALPARARPARTSPCRCTATTTSASPWRTRSPGSRPAAARSSARSTASASAPATPRSRRS